MTTDIDYSVYRLKIQPGGAKDGTDPYEFCKDEGIVGIGWGYNNVPFSDGDDLDDVAEIADVETAVNRHNEIEQRYIERRGDDYTPSRVKQNGDLKASLRYMIAEMEVGDLVWVNEGSEFAVCQITGEWEVDLNGDANRHARYARNDIRNFREAEWNVVPYTMVPGFVKRRFAGQGSTLSKMRIEDERKAISKEIASIGEFNETADGIAESVAAKLNDYPDPNDVLEILDPVEIEDIVLLLLQDGDDGWSVIKSSTNSSEADVECELRRVVDDRVERAFVQVKSGGATVSPAAYAEKAEHGHVFLFTQSPLTVSQENMSAIPPTDVLTFMQENPGLLPDPVSVKLDAYL